MADRDRVATLTYQGKPGEARDVLVKLAAACADDRDGEAAVLLARASELALVTEGVDAATDLANQACERGEASAEATARAEAYLALARVHLRAHTDTALDDAGAALARIDGLDASRLSEATTARRHKLTGLLFARRGQPRRALEQFALGYARAEGHAELRARMLLTWAVQLRNWGLFADAQRKAERSLEVRLQLGDHAGAAMCYGTLAFIYQRQGLWEKERNALAADLRLCERIGVSAEVPALHGRLAGALVGMGKYAGAWAEADTSISLENERLGLSSADAGSGTRVHGFAWREQARVCLAQQRLSEGIRLADQAAAVFQRLADGYGEALAQLTLAELALAQAAGGDADASQRVSACLAKAQPVFVRLGAVPEAIDTILLDVETQALAGRGEQAATRIVQQVLPTLQQAGLGATHLFQRARETLQRLAPAAAFEYTATQASMLHSLAAIAVETDPQPATVVAVDAGAEAPALRFARAAVDQGGVVSWPSSRIGVAILLGPNHRERAQQLMSSIGDLAIGTADGEVDLEHMWPAGARARGEAVEAALAELAKAAGEGDG